MPTRDPLPAILGGMDIYLIDQIQRERIQPTQRVLDAGCGGGRNLHYLLKAGYVVYGMDPNPERVEAVQALARRLQPRLPEEHFQAGTLEANGFPDQVADVVLCNAVLHFARDTEHFEAMLAGAWRLLTPDGILFVRLASNIGIETAVQPLGQGRFRLPDGSDRYLVDADTLRAISERWGAELLDPIKTTVVDGMRSMTTWVLRKPSALQ